MGGVDQKPPKLDYATPAKRQYVKRRPEGSVLEGVLWALFYLLLALVALTRSW